MPTDLSRRDALQTLGLAGLSLTLAGALPRTALARAARPAAAHPETARVLRVAHFTDVHVQPELAATRGFAECLAHIGNLKDQPDLLINTGDCVMDSMETDEARTKLQWDLWTKCLKDGPQRPILHALGNHDIWGVNKKKSKTTGHEPRYGKKWACEQLALDKPYYRHDRAGWAFLTLDSVTPLEDTYDGRLDPEQMDWFKAQLKSIPATTPIMVLSHIPILTVTPMADAKEPKDKAWSVSTARMMADWPAFRDLFRAHKSVKCCVSGHLHQLDRIEFEGVTYLGNGAVSGAWWKGPRNQSPCGYAVLDLYPDGRVERQYIETGWVAVKE